MRLKNTDWPFAIGGNAEVFKHKERKIDLLPQPLKEKGPCDHGGKVRRAETPVVGKGACVLQIRGSG